jgi:outer membrane usher protein
MPWVCSIRKTGAIATLAMALALGFYSTRVIAGAADVCELQLEVFLNRTPTHLIGSFTVLAGGRIAARRAELEEIGLKPRGYASPDAMIALDDLSGLAYRYDEPSQQLFITVHDELRATKEVDASAPSREQIAVRADYGGVLNYTLFSSAAGHWTPRSFAFSGHSASLDARAFSPFGTLSQSAILRSSFNSRFDALRLDTTFAYSDRENTTTYRAGDEISGALAWTRPIRIGGLQAQRNFGLRPDLVTLPLPSAAGSAAVPSTVDVFVNNVRTSSQEIESGPFRISNVPATTGSGTARVVLRDASGRETVTDLPFYVSPKLLAPGLFDFSMEAGVPRLSYATPSDTYSNKFVASASARMGYLDWLTFEGHAEGGAGLVNVGGGAVVRTGSVGVASAALAASYVGRGGGWQSYLSYDTNIFGVIVQLSSQRTFGAYDDLASVTARLQRGVLADPQVSLAGLYGGTPSFSITNPALPVGAAPAPLWLSARPAKALDRVSIGLPLPFDLSSLSLSYIHLNDVSGRVSNVLSASWSHGLGFSATAFVTAYADLSDRKRCGFLLGLSIPLGEGTLASSGLSNDRSSGTNVTVDVVKPLAQQPGSFGWRLHDGEGSTPDRAGAVAYRSSAARMEATVRQVGNDNRATAEVEGAVVTMGNGVFLANRIDDAFAVIDTGVPGVEVFHENRSVGFTDSAGRALIPGLRSYQKNKIAIDTRNLPVDADISTSQDVIAPADRSGVRVNFAVRTDVSPAVLVLTGADGAPLPAGSHGKIEGGEEFFVGYDGRAWVKGLGAQNSISVALPNRECRAAFAYTARPNEQVSIPVTCR